MELAFGNNAKVVAVQELHSCNQKLENVFSLSREIIKNIICQYQNNIRYQYTN